MNKKTLVIGASLKRERYSNLAINKLVNNGIEVLAIGSQQGEVSGVTIQTEMTVFDDINTLTLYLNPIAQKPYYNYIINIKPQRVIFNPGTENPELFDILNQNNIYFELSCTLTLLATNQY